MLIIHGTKSTSAVRQCYRCDAVCDDLGMDFGCTRAQIRNLDDILVEYTGTGSRVEDTQDSCGVLSAPAASYVASVSSVRANVSGDAGRIQRMIDPQASAAYLCVPMCTAVPETESTCPDFNSSPGARLLLHIVTAPLLPRRDLHMPPPATCAADNPPSTHSPE